METEVAREIQVAVQDHLSKIGVAGEVVVVGANIELRAGGAPVAVELHFLGEQWPLLPPEHRERKVGEVARRLMDAARARPQAPARPSIAARVPVRGVYYAAGFVALLLAGAFLWLNFGDKLGLREPDAEVAAPVPTENDQDRRARQARVCDAARKRLFSGASIGPLDTEGWVVELWLGPREDGKTPLDEAKKLVTPEGRLSPEVDKELAELSHANVEVGVGLALAGGGESGAVLRFTGAFTGVFLDPQQQGALVRVAERVYDRTTPKMAALYARCAHKPNHDVGAWFVGKDPGLAAAAVVFAIGGFTEGQPIAAQATDLDAVMRSTAPLVLKDLSELAKGEGGDVVELDRGVTISFPVAAGIRPIGLSRTLAKKAGLGP